MNSEQVKTKIKSLMHELMGLDFDSINEDAFLYEDYGADSIIIVQIFLSCQDFFKVKLDDEVNLSEPISVNSLSQIILRKL